MLMFGVLLILFTEYGNIVESTRIFGGFQRVYLCRCGVSRLSFGTTRTGRLETSASVVPHEYPWLAAITVGSQVVAGSLISDRHVLTAASPLNGLSPDNVIITLGAHNRCSTGGSALNVSVTSISIRPGYSPTSQENDLALIKLKHVVAFSKYISPICLPLFGFRDSEYVTWTAGWSENGSCIPHVAVLPSLPVETCLKDTYSNLTSKDKGCLGPLGTKSVICKNDVGSPVMARWTSMAAYRLIGVVSTSSCDVTSPPLFVRVIDHIGWIYENIRSDYVCL